jgi:uncharacterized protein
MRGGLFAIAFLRSPELLPGQCVRLRLADQLRVAPCTGSIRIRPTLLSPAALRAVVEEFVTRDGKDHSLVERRIEAVMRQLDAGRAELHFDGETQTCNILPVEAKPPKDDGDK